MQPGTPTPGSPPPPASRPRSYRPSAAAIVTLVAAVVGFGCSLNSSSQETVNGATVSCSYFDFGALAFAVVTAVAAVVTLIGARRPPRQPLIEAGIGVLGLAIAAVHVARAFGVIGGPC